MKKILFIKTSKVYNKHLTPDKRIKIEKATEENKNFAQIDNEFSKSPKTIFNET